MITHSIEAYKPELKKLWKLCFNDSDRFIQFYFDNIYQNQNSLVFLNENHDFPVAFLQIIPYQIKIGQNLYNAGYISGAMTHPEYRHKGYMHKLLTASFEEMRKKGYDYTFLIPQKKELIAMYAKYGFRLSEPNPQPPENKVLKTLKQWEQIQQDFFDENGIWLETEPIFPNEQKGMVKQLNPSAKDVTSLYLGMMLD